MHDMDYENVRFRNDDGKPLAFEDANEIIENILPKMLDDHFNTDKQNRRVIIYKRNNPVGEAQRWDGNGHYTANIVEVDYKTKMNRNTRNYACIVKDAAWFQTGIKYAPSFYMKYFMTLKNDDNMQGPVKVLYYGDKKSSEVELGTKEDAIKFAEGDAFTNSVRVINVMLGTTQKSEAHWAALDKLIDIIDQLH
jgi:hypothetical protein